MSVITGTIDQQTKQQTQLLHALKKSKPYPHSVSTIQHIETHISHVLLTGEYVYKIKKPLRLGFLDFSTPQLRKFYCQEEIRLNRRSAAQIYLDVVAFCGTATQPIIRDTTNDGFEYAVRMRQFDTTKLLNQRIRRNEFSVADSQSLARALADFHKMISRTDSQQTYGDYLSVIQPCKDNFQSLAKFTFLTAYQSQIKSLAEWSEIQANTLREVFEERKNTGHIKECHGDLHSGNIVWLEEKPVFFDCLEFNPNLRWIDTANELAFLLMDLERQACLEQSRRLLNDYLEITGDYSALCILDFYRLYRAMVRTKVAAIAYSQTKSTEALAEIHTYFKLTENYQNKSRPCLVLMHGLSGSGKTFIANQFVDQNGMVRLRSDVERKRLHGLTQTTKTNTEIEHGIYSTDATVKTYRHLANLAEQILTCGFNLVIDAAFLQVWQRKLFFDLAERLQISLVIVSINAAIETLQSRLQRRASMGTDASEANLETLRYQLQSQQPLTNIEQQHTLLLENHQESVTNASAQLKEFLKFKPFA